MNPGKHTFTMTTPPAALYSSSQSPAQSEWEPQSPDPQRFRRNPSSNFPVPDLAI